MCRLRSREPFQEVHSSPKILRPRKYLLVGFPHNWQRVRVFLIIIHVIYTFFYYQLVFTMFLCHFKSMLDEFKDFFSKYGKVADHQIMRDHATKRSRGFGFIIFESEQVVDDLLSKGNYIDLAGSKVSSSPC